MFYDPLAPDLMHGVSMGYPRPQGMRLHETAETAGEGAAGEADEAHDRCPASGTRTAVFRGGCGPAGLRASRVAERAQELFGAIQSRRAWRPVAPQGARAAWRADTGASPHRGKEVAGAART